MLYLHETHAVIGEHETTFEELVRDQYLPVVAADDGARLLWFLDSTHGSGEGYKVVTITALADGSAYERHVDRMLSGDLAAYMREADELRYRLDAALLVSVGADVDLATLPAEAHEHEKALVRQDTIWALPDADLDAGLADALAAGDGRDPDQGAVLALESAFRPVLAPFGETYRVVLQRFVDHERWVSMWRDDRREWPGGAGPLPGTARRQSRTLRTSSWSPLA